MKKIIGGPGSGKTAILIERSAETGAYILVTNKARARFVADQAIGMGIKHMPYPVTIEEYRHGKFDGSIIRDKGILIDDAEDLIKHMLVGVDVKAITLRNDDVNMLNDRIKWKECEYDRR